MTGRVLRGLGLAVVVLSLLIAGRIAYIAYGPTPGPRQLTAQVAFLAGAIDRGAGGRMQLLFPEGDYFLHALTAGASSAAAPVDLTAARAWRDHLDAPATVALFGSGMVPEHGIFQAGWALSTAVDLAMASGEQADRADVERRARAVDAAFQTSRTGFLAGYPQQYWPCDSVVGAAALARAAQLLDRPDWLRTVRAWREQVGRSVDSATGLLPHRVDEGGHALEGPRGSSQSIIQAFWPAVAQALDDQPDAATWQRFTQSFVVREAGLVGVREFPRGTAGAGDVDSGPLVLGVSASASAVTLAAARAVGARELANALSRESELLGLPVGWAGQRCYVLGLVPVGDAFLAWARSRPEAAAPVGGATPDPAWPAMIGVALLPGLLAGLLLVRAAPRPRGLRSPMRVRRVWPG